MLFKFHFLIFFLLTYSLLNKAKAQLIGDLNINQDQKEFYLWFDNLVGTETLPIYNGVTYPLRIKARNGHQFFKDSKWQNGNVHYKGQWYFDIPLLYDIVDNQLIVKYQNHAISADMSGVDNFIIGKNVFLKRTRQNQEEFYELLYKGDGINLLVKHRKQLKLTSEGYEAKKNTSYFLEHNDNILALRAKKSLKEITPNAKAIAKNINSKEAKFNLRKQDLLIEFIKRFDEELH